VRPISARIRQSLFDILRPRLPSARFLDLYAGTGTVGLEALSRGAESVVFVEKDKKVLAVIEKNILRMGWQGRGKAFHANVLAPLTWIPYRSGVSVFDLIFMGPPYVDKDKNELSLCTPTLANVASANLLSPTGWIISQHHQNEEPKAPSGYAIFRCERYGDSRMTFLHRA
jgi:16S rRNA (guanine966-N2)-methyltransferase